MSTGKKRGVLSTLIIGVFLGIILWGGFNTAMEATNTERFCISCHEMEAMVYEELQETIHFTNRTGVRATCPDCHVPKEWIHKVVRKVQATNELYHKMMGTIDTEEKFEEKRLELARNVWRAMKKTDSRECRNCHKFESMDLERQDPRSSESHDPHYWDAVDGKPPAKTCIDCHKGIAHQLPEGYDPAEEISLD